MKMNVLIILIGIAFIAIGTWGLHVNKNDEIVTKVATEKENYCSATQVMPNGNIGIGLESGITTSSRENKTYTPEPYLGVNSTINELTGNSNTALHYPKTLKFTQGKHILAIGK